VDNWFGPYRIWEASPAGYYRLEELDGTQAAQSVAGNRLKRFFTRRMRESTLESSGDLSELLAHEDNHGEEGEQEEQTGLGGEGERSFEESEIYA